VWRAIVSTRACPGLGAPEANLSRMALPRQHARTFPFLTHVRITRRASRSQLGVKSGAALKIFVVSTNTASSPEPTYAGHQGFGRHRASKYRGTQPLEPRNTSQPVPPPIAGQDAPGAASAVPTVMNATIAMPVCESIPL
jgi:hypothetical protein